MKNNKIKILNQSEINGEDLPNSNNNCYGNNPSMISYNQMGQNQNMMNQNK